MARSKESGPVLILMFAIAWATGGAAVTAPAEAQDASQLKQEPVARLTLEKGGLYGALGGCAKQRDFTVLVDGVNYGKGCDKTIELQPGSHTVVFVPESLAGSTERRTTLVNVPTGRIDQVQWQVYRYEPKGRTTLEFRAEGGAQYELILGSRKSIEELSVQIRRKKPKLVVAKGSLTWERTR